MTHEAVKKLNTNKAVRLQSEGELMRWRFQNIGWKPNYCECGHVSMFRSSP